MALTKIPTHMLFSGAASEDLSIDSNTLFIDASANRVGIANNSPSVALDVTGALTVSGAITGTLATAAQTNITSLGTLSSLAVGAITSTASSTISTADNTAQLTLISTDTDANQGPILNLNRNPNEAGADNDYLGQIYWTGHNDAGTPEDIVYSKLTSQILDASDGTEDANMVAYVMKGGSRKDMFRLGPTETVFNEGSEDIDFRVESNGNANMLFVDGGNDRVGIGTASPTTKLQIMAASDEEDVILLEDNSGTDVGALRIHGGAFMMKGKSATAPVQMQTHDGNEDIEVDPDGFIKMETAGSERLRIDSSGNVGIGNTIGSFHSSVLPLIVGSGSGDEGMAIYSGSSSKGKIGFADAATDDSGSYRGYFQYDHSGDNLNIGTAGSERMRIDSSGNVGIGTASPSTLLHAKSGSTSSFIRVDNSADGHDTGFEIYQNGSRKWEIVSDDSASDALSIRGSDGGEDAKIRSTGVLEVGAGFTSGEGGSDGLNTGIKMSSYTHVLDSTDISNGYCDITTNIGRSAYLGIAPSIYDANANVAKMGVRADNAFVTYADGYNNAVRVGLGGDVAATDTIKCVVFYQ